MQPRNNKLPTVVEVCPPMDPQTLGYAHMRGAMTLMEQALTDSYVEPTVGSIAHAIGCIEKFNTLATKYIDSRNISVTRQQIEHSIDKNTPEAK